MAYARLLKSVLQKKSCEGKRAYATRKEAREAVKQLSRKNRAFNVGEYRCQFCGELHIGHTAQAIAYGQGVRTISC